MQRLPQLWPLCKTASYDHLRSALDLDGGGRLVVV